MPRSGAVKPTLTRLYYATRLRTLPGGELDWDVVEDPASVRAIAGISSDINIVAQIDDLPEGSHVAIACFPPGSTVADVKTVFPPAAKRISICESLPPTFPTPGRWTVAILVDQQPLGSIPLQVVPLPRGAMN